MGAELKPLQDMMKRLHVRAIEQLSEKEKTILHLHLVLGMNFDDIGQLLDLDFDGVQKRFKRAMYLIAERVAPETFDAAA